MAKLRKVDGVGIRGGEIYIFFCPGCRRGHPFEVPHWTWNGSFDAPTFSPSLLCNESFPKERCHLFVKDGKIQFLSDCHHELKGQTVDMVDF